MKEIIIKDKDGKIIERISVPDNIYREIFELIKKHQIKDEN